VSPELPPALVHAIDRELEGVSRRDLATRAAVMSEAYRAGGGSAGVIGDAKDALAYALTRLPATYAAALTALAETQRRAPEFRPLSLLDAGAGPGGASWAAAAVFEGLTRATLVDANAVFLDLAGRLMSEAPPALREAVRQRGDLGGTSPRADLVVASYALAEIPAGRQAAAVGALWAACEGALVLIEPGTSAGYARILAARAALIAEGAQILAPCPHDRACPLVAPDWCHFSVRLPRRKDHRLIKAADAPFEDEKFAYLAAARPGIAAGPGAARVLAPPRVTKPGIALKVCGPEGLEARLIAKRDKTAYAAARRLGWGDVIAAKA
jgi:ribosomal protein RSM22 (predicted rRNA methylase)